MKIGKAILGVIAGVTLSGSTMAQAATKETKHLAKDGMIAKVMQHIKLPKRDTADAFVATFQDGQKMKAAAKEVVEKGFSADSSKLHYEDVPLVVYEKSGLVAKAPKSSIKLIDLDYRQDITKEINDIDSTIIKDGGIDMAKVDSLEYVFTKETKNNLTNNQYENVLDNLQSKKYDKLVNVKKNSKAYKQMQKENIVDSMGNINPVDSAQAEKIKAKMKINEKRDLMAKLAYPEVDIMVKTRSIKKMGKDLYQQAEMDFHGDIKALALRGRTLLDTINTKAAEAKMKFENPLCGQIGLATTDSVRIIANTCEDCSTPAIKPQSVDSIIAKTDSVIAKADSIMVKDIPSSPLPSGQIIVDTKTYSKDTAKITKQDAGEYLIKKGDTFWGLATKALGPNAKNKDIAMLKNEILTLNNMTEQQAKHLKINSVVKMPAAYAQSQSAGK